MYDLGRSETNLQFVKGTLQSNFAVLQSDLWNHIRRLPESMLYEDLKQTFNQINQSNLSDMVQQKFSSLLNDTVKICGMLALCDSALEVNAKFDKNDVRAFDDKFVTSGKEAFVCFPGITITDVYGDRTVLQKVWVVTPRRAVSLGDQRDFLTYNL